VKIARSPRQDAKRSAGGSTVHATKRFADTADDNPASTSSPTAATSRV
jgi:hypothetical protein